MRQGARKFLGTILLMLLVTVWSIGAMAVAQYGIRGGNPWVELAYYVVAGLGWTLPAGALVWWMAKPDREA